MNDEICDVEFGERTVMVSSRISDILRDLNPYYRFFENGSLVLMVKGNQTPNLDNLIHQIEDIAYDFCLEISLVDQPLVLDFYSMHTFIIRFQDEREEFTGEN